MNIKILDCTIRDGGHLCNWEFDPNCVKASYYSALRSGVNYFEIGYRNPETIKGLGEFAYCKDEFLKNLLVPSDDCKVTVMIDAGKSDASLFKQSNKDFTIVKAVRVASYPYELKKAIGIVEKLYNKGYEVFLNLMACSELSKSEYDLLEYWDNKHMISAIYFADSFGSFIHKDIIKHCNKLKKVGFTNIGFHSHNNLQMAFANTLKAIEEGAKYIDASVYGMGRGSGNLPIEVIISFYEKNGYDQYNVVPYLDVLDRFYIQLFNLYKWGYSLSSLMTGIKNIHPYYVKNLYKKNTYTIDEIWNTLDIIKEKCPISFSEKQLDETLQERFYIPLTQEKVDCICESMKEQFKIIPSKNNFKVDDLEFKDKYKKRKFLIIANGPSILEYKDKIDEFIEEHNCITIGVNYLNDLFIPNYHMFISRKRFLKYYEFINKESILVIPSFWGKDIIEKNYEDKYSFFNIECIDDNNEDVVNNNTQKCINLNVTVSAILMAYQMGASEIFVVGMDGYIDELNKKMVYFYNEDDTIDDKEVAAVRYENLCKELKRVTEFLQNNSISFSIITPTSHKKYYKKNFK